MVFFLISGLCIHLPYSGKSELPLGSFLARRYLRVVPPLIVVMWIARLTGTVATEALDGVVWSVYAELFYYTTYPALFLAKARWGWKPLIFVSSLVAVGVAAWFAHAARLPGLGWWVWLWGWPIWMCGCVIADCFQSGRFPASPLPLWAWRALAWTVSVVANFLVFRGLTAGGYQFSMLVFSAIAFFWLTKELTSGLAESRLFERLGAASYSLYLAHPVALGAIEEFAPTLPPVADIAAKVAAVAAGTCLLYFAVEAPSHRLARAASGFVSRRARPA
jgi:peptidoglycan/LPS O-acetylase OafA/YrhL